MARKGNPISLRMYLNRSSDSSWFSDYYYSKLVYQDVNLRSYFGSIRPPTRLTFGFRLGRCIILHFPKRTFIHFFLPRRLKRRKKTRPGKEKGRWWTFGKVGPIGCLHSSDDTEEERNEVKGWGARKRVESIRLDDRKKQNEIRIWPKKKQRYGYHDRPPSIKKNDPLLIDFLNASSFEKVRPTRFFVLFIIIFFLLFSTVGIALAMEPQDNADLDLTLRLGQPIQRGEAIYQEGAPGVEGEVPHQEEAPLCPKGQRIKNRLLLFNPTKTISNEEISQIIFLKNEIINRMSQLDQNSFWVERRNQIISEAILSNEGREYRIDTLRRYLNDLSSANAPNSNIFKKLTQMRKDFRIFDRFF